MSSTLRDIVENVCIVMTVALVGAFVLIGGHMIGSASAHSNRVEHERQFHCVEIGGEMKFVGESKVCVKD